MDEDRVVIETPEHVQFSFELAGLGSRFLALTVDVLVLAVAELALVFLVAYLTSALNWVWPGLGEVAGIPVVVIVIVASSGLASLAYFVFFEAFWSGQTPGKRLAGLRVIRAGGGPIGFLESATRNILRIVDFLPALYLLGAVFVFFTETCQRIGDLAAGTIVVKERLWEYPGQQPTPEAVGSRDVGIAGTVATAAANLARGYVGLLSREQIETIRRFVERRTELAPETRAELAARIAAPLAAQFPGLLTVAPTAEELLEVIYQTYLERRQDL